MFGREPYEEDFCVNISILGQQTKSIYGFNIFYFRSGSHFCSAEKNILGSFANGSNEEHLYGNILNLGQLWLKHIFILLYFFFFALVTNLFR